MGKLNRIINLLWNLQYKYLLYGAIVIVDASSQLTVGKKCKIRHSKIVLKNGNRMQIGNDCHINKCVISSIKKRDVPVTICIDSKNTFDHVSMLIEDDVRIGAGNTFSNVENYSPIEITVGGPLTIGGGNRINCRLWQRFGGKLTIGNYNCINERTEIRSDESVTIGSYNMISYDCCIWDTNTHCIYPKEQRRAMTEDPNLFIGYEKEKPVTKPVAIGDDNWIARYCSIMKGCTIGNECILAYRTLLLNRSVANNSLVYDKVETCVKPR